MRVTPEERVVIVAWEKKVILLAGVPGAGKTHTRKNDSALAGLPHLDIADVYREYLEDPACRGRTTRANPGQHAWVGGHGTPHWRGGLADVHGEGGGPITQVQSCLRACRTRAGYPHPAVAETRPAVRASC